jgi:hypothetical protein
MKKNSPEEAAAAKRRVAESRARNRPLQKQRNAELIERLREEMGGRCAVCGSTNGLEFAHLSGTTKLFNVAVRHLFSEKKVRAEAAKCRLLCQAHHRAETRSQRLGKRIGNTHELVGEEKRCSDCDTWKDLSCFAKNKARPDGRQQVCRDCFYVRVSARSQSMLEYINSHKIRCADCEETHKDLLEFDHVRGTKLYNVSKMLSYSKEVVDAEIAKCEVVCRNHHKERTGKRKGPPKRPLQKRYLTLF